VGAVVHCAQLPGEFLVSVDGDFGATEVQAMKDALRAVAPGARITLDFSHAQRMQEFAIAGMAQVLDAMKGSAVRVCGLCRHHLRILAYMGAHIGDGAEARPSGDG